MSDQRISEQQLQALHDADEYSLRHHSSEVGLLIESYREVSAELEVAHIACQLSIAENIQLRSELNAFKKPVLRQVTGFNTECLVCGQHHAGMGGLPCPNMTPMAGGRTDG